MRVPTFYKAEIPGSPPLIQKLLSAVQWIIAYIFSAMFASCSILPFVTTSIPTFAERLVWTFSSLVSVIFVPVLFGFAYMSFRGIRPTLIAKISAVLLGIYILTRIILFVLGFTTLRGLPPAALNTIHWPKFILILTGN